MAQLTSRDPDGTDSEAVIFGSGQLPARWPNPLKITPWIVGIAEELKVALPKLDDPLFEALKTALVLEDQLADDLAGWVRSGSGHRALFDRVLDEGAEALAPLAEPLAKLTAAVIDYRPEWADSRKMVLGAETHLRLSTTGQLASGSLGLLEGYRSASVAKSLVTTGSLVTSSGRRLAETSKFFNEVVMSDGMGRFSDGFKATVRVRLIHAFVRFGLCRSDQWRKDLWGMPISILDSLGTALAFWVPVVRAAPVFGYTVSHDEAEGMMILWNYVAWLQGVPETLLPRSLDDAYRLYVAIMMQVGEPDEDSRRLADAYMSVAEQKGDGTSWLQGKLVHGAAAALISPKHMRELGLSDTVFRHWPTLVRPLIKRQERRRLRDVRFHATLIAQGRRQLEQGLPEQLRKGHDYNPKTVVRDQSAFG